MIGLPCLSSEGEALGEIIAIENFGAGDVIEIRRPPVEGKSGKRFMVPMHAVALDSEQAVVDALFVE